MKYRLYIDEVGNSDLKSSANQNHRYLSLTGIALELNYIDQVVFPLVEDLKRRYFDYHVDDPICLHRKEILNRKPPFEALRNPEISQAFNQDILKLLEELDYTVFTVVIDKLEHLNQYNTWHYDPYHYCLEVLIERFTLWLEGRNQVGDVMAESRGGKEDMRLKKSFSRHFESGTKYIQRERIQKFLTSCNLKVQSKANNIAGLQIADLVAYPSFKSTMSRHQNQSLGSDFSAIVAKILEKSKYYRDNNGKIWGYGRKWLA